MGTLFEGFLAEVRAKGPVGVSLVEAVDAAALSALSLAEEAGFAEPWLVGDKSKIEDAIASAGIRFRNPRYAGAKGLVDSARIGVDLVRQGHCGILMKGRIPTPVLLKVALDKDTGLRTGRILSHVAAVEISGYDRFIFVTDGGVILAPDLEKKIQIANNAILVARTMGVANPRIALLGPTETPTLDSEASVHAAVISKMADRGAFPGALVDGPMALDVAVSAGSAKVKGVGGEVAGKADVLLAPDLISANTLAKSMQYFAGALLGGIIVGASSPIVVISRADQEHAKLCSLAMARNLISKE